jgi:hypothetical protein
MKRPSVVVALTLGARRKKGAVLCGGSAIGDVRGKREFRVG